MDTAEPTGTLRQLECRRLALGQVQNIKWVISALAPREKNRRQVWDGGAGRRAPPHPPSPSGAPCWERTSTQAQRRPSVHKASVQSRDAHTPPAVPVRTPHPTPAGSCRSHTRAHTHTHTLTHTLALSTLRPTRVAIAAPRFTRGAPCMRDAAKLAEGRGTAQMEATVPSPLLPVLF